MNYDVSFRTKSAGRMSRPWPGNPAFLQILNFPNKLSIIRHGFYDKKTFTFPGDIVLILKIILPLADPNALSISR